jgi:hypothetical protein
MNELGIIRTQLTVEQAHATEIANACAQATGQFRDACVGYLVWILARFEERDQTLSELFAARQSPGNDTVAAIARQIANLVSRSGTSREALSRLEAALAAGESPGARAAWEEFGRFFNSAWGPRRAALAAALAQHLSVAEWRRVCAIDADSILDERNRFGCVVAELPPGVELRRS